MGAWAATAAASSSRVPPLTLVRAVVHYFNNAFAIDLSVHDHLRIVLVDLLLRLA